MGRVWIVQMYYRSRRTGCWRVREENGPYSLPGHVSSTSLSARHAGAASDLAGMFETREPKHLRCTLDSKVRSLDASFPAFRPRANADPTNQMPITRSRGSLVTPSLSEGREV